MRITGSDKHKLVIKDINLNLIPKTLIFFVSGLLITINVANNRETTKLLTLLIGPILMASSFLYFVAFFKIITIVIDRYGKKILRNVKKISSNRTEKITIDDADSIALSYNEKFKMGLVNKTKTNIYITFEDESIIKLNNNALKDKKAINIAYEISSFLNIPMKRMAK